MLETRASGPRRGTLAGQTQIDAGAWRCEESLFPERLFRSCPAPWRASRIPLHARRGSDWAGTGSRTMGSRRRRMALWLSVTESQDGDGAIHPFPRARFIYGLPSARWPGCRLVRHSNPVCVCVGRALLRRVGVATFRPRCACGVTEAVRRKGERERPEINKVMICHSNKNEAKVRVRCYVGGKRGTPTCEKKKDGDGAAVRSNCRQT